MPWIDLTATNSRNQYKGDVTLTCDKFHLCDIFLRCEHILKSSKRSGNIQVYEKYTGSGSSRVTINVSKDYKSASLKRAEVYFNNYEKKTPLLLVLYYIGAKIKYYGYSKLGSLITHNRSIDIYELSDFKTGQKDKEILEVLFDENDQMSSLLTFQIDQKISNGTTYNNNKIKSEENKSEEPNLSGSEFTKYKHSSDGAGRGKKGCIIYNKNSLIENEKKPLLNFQNKQYWYVIVYWSSETETPLLLEVGVNDRKRDTNEFYCHIMNDKLFWEKLDSRNFERFTGYKFNGGDSIYNQLTVNNNNKLFKLLETLVSNLFKTIYFFVDKQNGNYSESDVKKSLGNYIYNLVESNGQIKITDKTVLYEEKCLGKSGFRVYEHNFTDTVSSISDTGNVKLKFIKSNNEDSEINYLTIDLDKQKSDRFMFKSKEFLISNGYNNAHGYTWFKHSSEAKITKGFFDIKFKEETIKINGDLSDEQSNNIQVIVYFKTGEKNKFLILAFPSKNLDEIWYLPYDVFKKNIGNQDRLRLSTLNSEGVNVKHRDEDDGKGQTIDNSLVKLLKAEYEKNYSLSIELNKQNGQNYKYGSLEIKVSENNENIIQGYKCFEHTLNLPANPFDIVFKQNNETTFLDLSEKINDKQINSVLIYFNNTNTNIPLIISLSIRRDKKYFKYTEFLYRINNTAKFSEIKQIKSTDILRELENQHKNLTNDVTFDLLSKKNYSGFDVSSANPFDNFKYYTHTPNQYFKSLKFKERSLFKFTEFKGSNYTYNNLLKIFVYYHGFDKDNSYPLLVQFFTRNFTREKQYEYNNIYYSLDNIADVTSIKTYKTTVIGYTMVTSVLNEKYEKFKNKLDTDLKISGSDVTHSLGFSRADSALYVYFYGDDPRPLLLCYSNKIYKRYHLGNRYSKWITVSSVSSCLCNEDQFDENILITLKQITESLCLIDSHEPSEQESEISIEIDTSKINDSYNNPNSITVSSLENYSGCNLFKYCTHSLKTSSKFKMSSAKIINPENKVITIESSIDNVISVNVYFHIHMPQNPILLEIILDNEKKFFMLNLDQKETIYLNSKLKNIEEYQLADELIKESDRINKRNTFQIDKTDAKYNSIEVNTNSESGKVYTIYTHSETGSTNKISDVLYNKKPLVIDSIGQTSNIDIQNTIYQLVKVYVMNVNKSLQLVIELKNLDSTSKYLYRKDLVGTFKTLDKFNSAKEEELKNKLDELYYFLKSSIIVIIDEYKDSDSNYSYEMKVIDNIPGSDGRTPKMYNYDNGRKTSDSKKIKVTDKTTSFSSLDSDLYKCYEHTLSGLKETPEANNIGGIRLFMKSSGNVDPVEIQLYDRASININNRIFLYYRPNETVIGYVDQSIKIQVFFHKYDTRPLLVYYNGTGYKRIKGDNNNQWYHDSNINISDTQVLRTLKDIYSNIKKKFLFLKDGDHKDVTSDVNQIIGSYRKDIYKPKVGLRNQEDLKLSQNSIMGTFDIRNSNINQLFGELYGKKFDIVHIYKNKNIASFGDVLLFEFIDEHQKTYFKKIDDKGNYWVKEIISVKISEDLLSNIKSHSANSVIYEVDKIQKNYNIDVNVSEKTDDQINGFKKYTHTPTKLGHKRSSFLYNGTKLVKKVGNLYQEIGELENHAYTNVSVYFGSKAKRKNGSDSIPLLIELIKQSATKETDYYIHKRSNSSGCGKYYWEQLNDTILNNVLIDIGFGMTKTDPGYDQLKKILTNSGVSITEGKDDHDLSSKLHKINNLQVKNILEQMVGEDLRSQKKILLLVLSQIEFDFIDSVVILLEKKNAGNYGVVDVNNPISNLHPKREINTVSMNGDTKKIEVSDKTEKKAQCVKDYKYKVYCHDISKIIMDRSEQKQSCYTIRFIMPGKTGGNYKMVRLYNKDKPEPQHVDYIYYDKIYNEVYVYFYGDDPRPLLLCYGSGAYKPKNLTNYNIIWVKVNEISNCVCQNDSIESPNKAILDALTSVVGCLNPVEINLKKLPSSANVIINKNPPQSSTYEFHKYTTTTSIEMKINSDALSCYYKYTYEPVGSDSKNEGFRLGNIIYTGDGDKKGNIRYDTSNYKYDPLTKVSCYYFNGDDTFTNPLLVILEFNGTKKEYYKLSSSVSKYEWISDTTLNEGNLLNELFKSNQSFNKDKQIPEEKICKQVSPTPSSQTSGNETIPPWVKPVAGTIGGLSGFGVIGGGGYLVYTYVFAASAPV